MAGAVLEFNYMPNNCRECTLSTKNNFASGMAWVCAAFDNRKDIDFSGDERAKFCPLKEVEE